MEHYCLSAYCVVATWTDVWLDCDHSFVRLNFCKYLSVFSSADAISARNVFNVGSAVVEKAPRLLAYLIPLCIDLWYGEFSVVKHSQPQRGLVTEKPPVQSVSPPVGGTVFLL